MGTQPSYFALAKAEAGRIIHDLNNAVGIAANNTQFLEESSPTMTTDERNALHDAAVSAKAAAELLRELQAIIG